MPKLIILSKDADEYRTMIEQAQLPDLTIVTQPTADCDIVLGAPTLIRDQFASLPNLKWVQSIWAGVEPLLDSTLRRDYILTNARGVFGELMSEFVFGYMLAHEKRIFQRQRSQHSKHWDKSESGWLRGKTLGLLGVGSIGVHLASVAKVFGLKVWGYTASSETSTQVDRYFHPLKSDPWLSDQAQKLAVPLLDFVAGLDYLVIILPRTAATNNLVNAEVLSALPSHALLINVGRGNAIDESALVEALTQNKIAGAVLDVTKQEPLPLDHPFWTTPNLLLTFHTSAMSYSQDIVKVFFENYHLYLEGKPLKYVVDFERGY